MGFDRRTQAWTEIGGGLRRSQNRLRVEEVKVGCGCRCRVAGQGEDDSNLKTGGVGEGRWRSVARWGMKYDGAWCTDTDQKGNGVRE